MGWKSLQRHKILRCVVCLVLAVLISVSPMVKAVVVAHASMSLTAVVAVVGTMLASVGITFATADALQRGVLTFYNGITADMRSFVDDSVQQYQSSGGGNNFLLLIPMLIMLPLAKLAADIFPRDAKEVPDASTGGAAGDAGWVNPADNWRNYVGKTFRNFVDGLANSPNYSDSFSFTARGLPFPVFLNSSPSGYLDGVSRVAVPISLHEDLLSSFKKSDVSVNGLSDFGPTYSPAFLASSENEVFRTYSPLGEVYDYQAHLSMFENVPSDGKRCFLLEVTENGKICYSRESFESNYSVATIPKNSAPYRIGFYMSFNSTEILPLIYFDVLDSVNKPSSLLIGKFKIDSQNTLSLGSAGKQEVPYHSSMICIIGGVFDKETGKPIDGAIPIPYLPDASISADNLIKDALEKYLREHPELTDADVSVPVSVPTNADDVIGKGWTDVMTDADIKEAIKDAIREWEEENPTVPPVDPGGPIKPPTLVPPEGMFSLFPFCIPFDIVRAFDCFTAPPVEPVFVIPFKYGNIVDEEITLDFKQWEWIIQIVRWGELTIYIVGLAVVTRNYIKW